MLTGCICGVVALVWAALLVRRAAAPLQTPLVVFIVFYVLTTAIGATVLAVPLVRDLWTATYPTMDTAWITPGDSWGYWFLVWGPLPVIALAADWCYPRLRMPVLFVARLAQRQVDALPVVLVGAAMCGYCFVNLAAHGYLGVSLLNSELIGRYRENIQLREEMYTVLGAVHYACIYMGIPALAIVALCNTVRRRGLHWALLFAALSAALVVLYAATLTKSNILIYGIGVVVAAYTLGVIRLRGLLIAALGGTVLLTGLSALLSGSSPLDFAITGYNLLFREASDVPFYLAVFPEQLPFVGIDLGLGQFGIGPTVPSNQVVANFMFPHETWAQGAAPAAAPVMAYAQAGYPWAFATMLAMGVWVSVTGQLRRCGHNPIVFSAFIGAVTSCYYLSQGDFVGAFNVAYGYKWWLGALLLLLGAQRLLRAALQPQPGRVLERGHAA
ncbi:MAG TPA: hypothetical protein VFO23_07200 [Steroidobacteraceae bacterium]|nr:hypothetical protein [Steroidobacteraceae bacterium]